MNRSFAANDLNPDPTYSVRRLIGIGVVTRLMVDTGVQIFFPFLRVIAEGIGITTVELGRLISLRSLTGLLSPWFGVLSDRRSNRWVMRLGLLLAALGYTLIGLSTNVWQAAAGMLLSGMGSFAYLPTLQAYLSARLPYGQRARGLGIVEYAWALSGILGLFLMGYLIAWTSWRVPMLLLGSGLFAAFVLYRYLPAGKREKATKPDALDPEEAFLNLGENGRSAWANIFVNGLIMFAAMNLFVTYGDWLETGYALDPAALGTVALVLGVFDLCASVLVSLVVDRLGKRRSVLLGSAVACLGFLLLPWFSGGVVMAVTSLVLARFSFEFTVVSNIPLLSEQVPRHRGKVMTFSTATGLLGTSLAGLSGPWALGEYGIAGVSLMSASAMLLTWLVVLWRVREPALQRVKLGD